MKKYFVILFASCFSICFTQNKTVKGIVLSAKDSLPLAYVNVYSGKYMFGAVSNELGHYIINHPDSISNFSLTYSSIGFSNKVLKLESIRDTIFLSPSVYDLDEVVLTNKKYDAAKILKNVYQNIKNNYSNKRHLLKAFYRQTAFNSIDTSYTRIIEADIGIQEYGILKSIDRDRIKVYQFRKSDDKITKKWYMEAAEKMFGKKNELVWNKKNDFIKNFVKNKDYNINYKNFLDNFELEFLNHTTINNHLVAVFGFYNKKLSTLNVLDEHKSKIYINLDDYAIIKATFIPLIKSKSSYKVIGGIDDYFYSKIGEYYYLTTSNNTNLLSNNENTKEYETSHLYVYEVELDRRNYDKIKRKEKEEIKSNIYEKNLKNDTLFWNNYKVLPILPLKKKLKTFLENSKSLENQFEDNGEKD